MSLLGGLVSEVNLLLLAVMFGATACCCELLATPLKHLLLLTLLN
jgi:hypothetical protein